MKGETLLDTGLPVYIQRLFVCAMEGREQRHIENALQTMYRYRVIDIACGTTETLQFDLSPKQQLNTVLHGMLSAHNGMWRARLGMLYDISAKSPDKAKTEQVLNKDSDNDANVS